MRWQRSRGGESGCRQLDLEAVPVAWGMIVRRCGWARGLREADAYAKAAAGHGVGRDGGVVCGRDGPDDGQSEPVPVLVVCPAAVEPLEGLEEAVDVRWRDEWPGVGHRQDGLALLHPRPDLGTAVGNVVADGIGEQVDHEPFDEQRVSIEGRGFCHLIDANSEPAGLGLQAGQCRRDGGGEVDGFVSAQPAFAAGQGEQCFDQARLLIAGGEHLQGGGAPGRGRRAGVVERNLEEGALGRQGGPQLMGGVGDEVPLGLEGGFEPREEAVEGIPEFLELVFRAVEGKAFVQAGGGDPPGPCG